KRRGIPTFPQPLRRLLGYIFNVSIAVLRVASLNVLTRPQSDLSWRTVPTNQNEDPKSGAQEYTSDKLGNNDFRARKVRSIAASLRGLSTEEVKLSQRLHGSCAAAIDNSA